VTHTRVFVFEGGFTAHLPLTLTARNGNVAWSVVGQFIPQSIQRVFLRIVKKTLVDEGDKVLDALIHLGRGHDNKKPWLQGAEPTDKTNQNFIFINRSVVGIFI
jgi:hypothetical protein